MKYYLLIYFLLLSNILNAQYRDSTNSGDYAENPEYNEYSDEDYNEGDGEIVHSILSPADVSEKNGYTREAVTDRKFDQKKWERIVGGEDFSEKDPKKKKKEADRDEGKSRKMNSDDASVDAAPIASPVLTYFVYAFAIAIIGYMIFLIARNVSIRSKGKLQAKSTPQDVTAPVEDIQELKIDRLLREAMASGNYPLAIRICFLGLLKKLDEDRIIEWKKDKTNRDYLSELFGKAIYFDEIRNLTRSYEEVWYGDHKLSVQQYQNILDSFQEINQRLKDSTPQ